MANSTVCKSKWKPKPKTYRQASTHWLKIFEEAVIVWGPNHRLEIQEWSIAINNDWVGY